jgi:hypothetical protein
MIALSETAAGNPIPQYPLNDTADALVLSQPGFLDASSSVADLQSADDLQSQDGQQTSDSTVDNDEDSRLENLEAELRELKDELEKQKAEEQEQAANKIKIGGAVRFQYSVEDYNAGNRDRGGDIDFDIFRIDFDGELGGVQLSAQYRWFQYMDVIHHGWVGYPLNDRWQTQIGITKVPFGNLPYNSHNFFFSSVFYVGLEDDHDAGIKFISEDENHDFRLAYFVTDEMGGIDGFVDNRADRYAYDLIGVRAPGEGTFDFPLFEIAEYNTLNMRYVQKYEYADVGASILYGEIRDRVSSVGNRLAYAAHLNSTIDRWNFQLQFTDYNYDVDDGAGLLVVGAYSFFDTIPAKATIYNCNVAYSLPVKWGPITKLTFYNDYNIMTNKSGGLTEDTVMNVTGIGVTAGGLYTYIDLVSAKNQPFIGGSMAGDDTDWNTRFNINVGFYF